MGETMAGANVGVALHFRTAADMLQGIADAQSAGLSRVWLTTGAGPDGLTVFAAALAATETIRLGTAIVPTMPRHPLVVAQQAADLHSISPGRFTLGLGPSHAAVMEGRYGIPYRKPLSQLREFVTVVKALLTGKQVDHEGEFYQVHARLFHAAYVPVIVSALRANSFALAAEAADGAVTWLCPARYLRDVALPTMDKHAAGPRPHLVAHAFLALNADAASIERGIQDYLGVYPKLANYQEMFAAAGFPEARQGAWSRAMLDAVLLQGDEMACGKAIDDFIAVSGCDELVLSVMPWGPDPLATTRAALDWLGTRYR
jgi:alkanesulfonate monooxygenase SsuD/methylene tetrahydromethanopterin reductase-like flavin-dependent oxidoreductase (luciferase family)